MQLIQGGLGLDLGDAPPGIDEFAVGLRLFEVTPRPAAAEQRHRERGNQRFVAAALQAAQTDADIDVRAAQRRGQPQIGIGQTGLRGKAQEVRIALDAGDQLVEIRWWRQLVKRSEEHTSELQSLMRISYAVFCLKKKTHNTAGQHHYSTT